MEGLPQNAQMGEVDELLKAKYDLETLLATERPSAAALELLENGQSELKLALPPTVWTYLTRPLEEQSYINFLTISNNIRIAKSANCSLKFISKDNYPAFLPKEAAGELERAIAAVRGARSGADQ